MSFLRLPSRAKRLFFEGGCRMNRRVVRMVTLLLAVLKLATLLSFYDSANSGAQHDIPTISLVRNFAQLSSPRAKPYGGRGSDNSTRQGRPPASIDPSLRIQGPASAGISSYQQISTVEVSGSASEALSRKIDIARCTVHRLGRTLVQADNTVVAAYYRLPSKHPYSKYDRWMRNFLSIEDPLVIFTQSSMVERIKELRSHAANRTVIVECEIDSLPIKSLGVGFWERQLKIDPEAATHKSYQLFWLWLSKSWWTVQAVHLNFFSSTFFLYSDFGSFRTDAYNNEVVVKYPDIVPDGTILWMAHHPPKPPPTKIWTSKRIRGHFYHSGSLGAGKADAWLNFHAKFANVLDAFVAQRRFVGEDQFVLQATCLLHPNLCAYLPSTQVEDNPYFGLRYALHNGPNSAVSTVDNQYRFWRPDGWNDTFSDLAPQ